MSMSENKYCNTQTSTHEDEVLVQTLMAAEQAYDGGRLYNVCEQSQYSQSDLRVFFV